MERQRDQHREVTELQQAHQRIGQLDLELRAAQRECAELRGRRRTRRTGRTRRGLPVAYADAVRQHWGSEAAEVLTPS